MEKSLLDFIRKNGIISFRKLSEMFPESEKELEKQLESLLNENLISKSVVLLCPECSITLGPVEQFKEGSRIRCTGCDYKLDVIKENFRTFFFSNCTIDI